MRTGYVLPVATGIAVGTSSSYLINQLPPIPDFPHKNQYLIGCVCLFTCLSIVVAIWQVQREAQKSLGVEQSTSRSLANHKQITGIPKQSYPKQGMAQTSHTQFLKLPWKPLFTLGLLHFCPALVLGLALQPSQGVALAETLAGVLVGAWVWTWAFAWAWTWAEGWVGVLIVFLAGAGWWALFLCLVLVVAWVLNGFWIFISSTSNSWSWTWALALAGAGALFLAKAWAWIGAVTVALALVGATTAAREGLERSFSQFQIFLILGLDAVIGMAAGGLIGWGIRVVNHY